MKRLIYRVVLYCERRAWWVIGGVAVVTLVLGWAALGIKADPDIGGMIPESREIQRLTEKYGSGNVAEQHLLLMFLGPDLFTARSLALVEQACDQVAAIEGVHAGITPFTFIGFENREGRLTPAPMAPGGVAPTSDAEALELRRRLLENPLTRNLVVSGDGAGLCAILPVDDLDDYRAILSAAEQVLAPLRPAIDARITGMLPVNQAMVDHIYGDLPIFLGVALAIILVSYYLGFGSGRSLLLPVAVVVLGTIWTVGTMALLGFRLSVVMIMTPPLVLILGSSYSLHTLNQYYREVIPRGAGTRQWIADAVEKVSVTIFLASVTTVFGFVSLLTCSLAQVRQFGLATAIGIAYCAVLALLFLPAVLSLLRAPSDSQRDRVLEGRLARFMAGLGRFVVRRRWYIIGASALIVAGFALTVSRVHYDTNFLRYFSYREPAVEANQVLIDRFTGYEYLYLTLSAPADRPGYFLDPAVLERVARCEAELAADPDVKYLSSFTAYLQDMNRPMTGIAAVPTSRPMVLLLSRYFAALAATPGGAALTGVLANRDFSRYTMLVHVWDHRERSLAFEASLEEILPRLEGKVKQFVPSEVQVEYWGETLTVLSASRLLTRDQVASIFSSAALVFLVSMIVFRSVRHGLVVLVPLAAGIMLNFIVMGLFSIPLDVVTITFASIAIGIGVDNAIHLTIWYRRMRAAWPADAERRIEETMRIAGRPMALTTLSITAALLVFVFSAFRPVVYFGLMISLSLVLTTLAALLLLPALLYIGGRRDLARAARPAATSR